VGLEEIIASTELPDELVLQVLGSRRPVLFVEGNSNSLDSALYRALYPDKLIFPMASCQNVIAARRGMQEISPLHNLSVEGLVDRDHRSDEEIAALRAQGVAVADVAEVENLFCVPAALQAAAEQLNVENAEKAVREAKARVLSELNKAKDAQVASRAVAEIQFRLGGFGPKAGKANASAIQTELTNHVASIDVAAVFKESADLFESIVATDDYDSALRYYNCKGIVSFVAGTFGLNARTYCSMVTGIIRSSQGASVAAQLRSRIS
jgi:hypothetical protein